MIETLLGLLSDEERAALDRLASVPVFDASMRDVAFADVGLDEKRAQRLAPFFEHEGGTMRLARELRGVLNPPAQTDRSLEQHVKAPQVRAVLQAQAADDPGQALATRVRDALKKWRLAPARRILDSAPDDFAQTELGIALEDELQTRLLWQSAWFETTTYQSRDDVESLVADWRRPDAQHWFLQVHAPGGTGKSFFLRRVAAHELVQDGIPVGLVDCDLLPRLQTVARHPWRLLVLLAQQLSPQLGRAFESGIASYLPYAPEVHTVAHRPPVQEQEQEPPDLSDSAFDWFTRTLASAAKTTPVVVIIDTVEELLLRVQPEVVDALFDLFRRVHSEVPLLRVVAAGRYDLGERLPGLVERLSVDDGYASLVLQRFRDDQASTYLVEQRRIAPDLAALVVDKTRKPDGHNPMLLSLLADHLVAHPDFDRSALAAWPSADLMYVFERVLDRIRPPQLQWIVRWLSVTRGVDPDFVAYVLEPVLQRVLDGEPLDDPHYGVEGLRRSSDSLGLQTESIEGTLFDALARYASGNSWVSHSEAQSRLRLHPEIEAPLRPLVSAQPVVRAICETAFGFCLSAGRFDEAVHYGLRAEPSVDRLQVVLATAPVTRHIEIADEVQELTRGGDVDIPGDVVERACRAAADTLAYALVPDPDRAARLRSFVEAVPNEQRTDPSWTWIEAALSAIEGGGVLSVLDAAEHATSVERAHLATAQLLASPHARAIGASIRFSRARQHALAARKLSSDTSDQTHDLASLLLQLGEVHAALDLSSDAALRAACGELLEPDSVEACLADGRPVHGSASNRDRARDAANHLWTNEALDLFEDPTDPARLEHLAWAGWTDEVRQVCATSSDPDIAVLAFRLGFADAPEALHPDMAARIEVARTWRDGASEEAVVAALQAIDHEGRRLVLLDALNPAVARGWNRLRDCVRPAPHDSFAVQWRLERLDAIVSGEPMSVAMCQTVGQLGRMLVPTLMDGPPADLAPVLDSTGHLQDRFVDDPARQARLVALVHLAHALTQPGSADLDVLLDGQLGGNEQPALEVVKRRLDSLEATPPDPDPSPSHEWTERGWSGTREGDHTRITGAPPQVCGYTGGLPGSSWAEQMREPGFENALRDAFPAIDTPRIALQVEGPAALLPWEHAHPGIVRSLARDDVHERPHPVVAYITSQPMRKASHQTPWREMKADRLGGFDRLSSQRYAIVHVDARLAIDFKVRDVGLQTLERNTIFASELSRMAMNCQAPTWIVEVARPAKDPIEAILEQVRALMLTDRIMGMRHLLLVLGRVRNLAGHIERSAGQPALSVVKQLREDANALVVLYSTDPEAPLLVRP